MTERQALQKRRLLLLRKLAEVANEIAKIDRRLNDLLAGNRGQGGAAA